MYGRDGYFFDLLVDLLETYPQVVIWGAGDGNDTILRRRLRPYLEWGRVKLIGNRQDINHVFRACDIYISTYPITGGLMAQLAIAKQKPILAFTTPDLSTNYLEDIIGTPKFPPITSTEVANFRVAAFNLITDPEKRHQLLQQAFACKA